MKGLDKWSPLAVLYCIGLAGVILVLFTVVRHPPANFASVWTTDNITGFFAKVALILTLLSPIVAKGIQLFVDARVQVVQSTATQAHETATTAIQAVNGPLSVATADAVTEAIKVYASTGDVNAAHTTALERMKARDVPSPANGGLTPSSGSGGS